MRIVVLGAGGQLGREVVRAVAASGGSVCAVVRRPAQPAFDNSVQVRIADARNKAQVRAAITGFDVVVNTIGGGTLRKNDVESSTTAIAVDAAQDVHVNPPLWVALDWMFFKYILRPLVFRNILAEHLRVEEIVKASELNWTIVRPPRLTSGPSKRLSGITATAPHGIFRGPFGCCRVYCG